MRTGARSACARVAPSDASVLVTGEHGTGKELVARLLHAASPRAHRPLITVNVGGLVGGRVRERAVRPREGRVHRRRTPIAPAASSWPTAARCSSTRSRTCRSRSRRSCCACCRPASSSASAARARARVNVRVISATNADLRAEFAAGRFREDLLFRLNTVEIHLPPLRERREDMPALAAHFLARHARRYRKPIEGFDDDALARAARPPVAGQRARAGPRDRARRAHGARNRVLARRRPRPAAPRPAARRRSSS